jgi:hypothetical protein
MTRRAQISGTPTRYGAPPTRSAGRSTRPSTSTSSSACCSSSTSPTPSSPVASSSRPSWRRTASWSAARTPAGEPRRVHGRAGILGPARGALGQAPEPGDPRRHRHVDRRRDPRRRAGHPNLKGKLPRDYWRRGIAPEKMTALINLLAQIGFKGSRDMSRDMLHGIEAKLASSRPTRSSATSTPTSRPTSSSPTRPRPRRPWAESRLPGLRGRGSGGQSQHS